MQLESSSSPDPDLVAALQTSLPLTRSCRLSDFPACGSVSRWQQYLADDAYARWATSAAAAYALGGATYCFNWGAATFRALGQDPHYFTFVDPLPVTQDPTAVVYALSVLDRIPEPMRFFRQQEKALLPGGLMVCTFACWNITGEDCAVGHELRARIYDPASWRALLYRINHWGAFHPFGGVDLRYAGDALGDHTLATLVLQKGDR